MSTTIDQRVVEMRFDNKQFESNVSDTMSTLDKLKQKLNFTGSSKGFEEISNSAKKVDMNGLGMAVETVQAKFSALGVMGVTALANITNSAVNTSKRMLSALTIDPIRTGFSEYETKINSIQTIMANTASKGTTMEDVTRVIGELNTYADKTIYNFAEMTRNIGTFTAAGIGLEDSATAIQGIANLAAVSGSNSQQASTAMYQLSQAMASGTVKLMDWNSVVNAGMGGQVFQDALKNTARAHGIAVDEIIEKNGSFRESLQEGWITTEILTETLSKMTKGGAAEYLSKLTGVEKSQIEAAQKLVDTNKDGSASYEELAKKLAATGKVTKQEAIDILKMADNAEDAATKVKTFTQLWDTLKESAQSGWSQTWEILVGDFEEAKETLTKISDIIGGVINSSAEARNKLLQGWKDAGGRADIVDSFFNTFEAVKSVVVPIKDAFREIFPPTTVEQLKGFSEGLKEFTAKLKLSSETSDKLKRTFKGLFAVLDIAKQIIVAVFKAIGSMTGSLSEFGGGILDITASIGDWFVRLSEGTRKTDIFNKALQGVVKVTKFVLKGFTNLINGIKNLFTSMSNTTSEAFNSMNSSLEQFGILDVAKSLWNGVKNITANIIKAVKKITESLGNTLSNGGLENIVTIIKGLVTGGVGVAVIKFINSLKNTCDGVSDIVGNIRDVFGELGGVLRAYQSSLKANSLIKIAGAIAILAASVLIISLIDSNKLYESVIAIGMLFAGLTVALNAINKSSGNISGIAQASTMMLVISTSVLILASALKKISNLDFEQLLVGIIGVGSLLAMIVGVMKLLEGSEKSIKGATQIVILAAAIKVLASACADIGDLQWGELAKGLVGVAGLLGAVLLFMNNAKFGGKAITTATGIVLIAASVKILASACTVFASMSWDEVAKGLLAVMGILSELMLFTYLNGDSKKMISTGIGLIAIGTAMKIFASATKDMGNMAWDQIARGLVTMGGALTILTIALKLMPKNMIATGVGLLAISSALLILSSVLSDMSSMSWESIGKGMVALGGSMAILAIGLNAMRSTLSGSAAMMIAAVALAILAPVLINIGSIGFKTIAAGLIAIASAFAIIGLSAKLLTPVIPAIIKLAAAFALFGVAALALGVGIVAISTGLASLVASLSGSVVILVDLVAAIITGVIKGLGDGIILLFDMIAASASSIGEAIKVLILTVCDILVECAPTIAETILYVIMSLLKSLAEYTPRIVDALFDFLIGILESLSKNIPRLIPAAVDVIMSLFEGVIVALDNADPEVLVKGILCAGLIATLMSALAAAAVLAPAAMIGAVGVGAVIAELSIVLSAIGALAQLPGLKWLVSEGGNFLEIVGTAIGQFIGGLAGGFAQGVTASLPQIANDLSQFMYNIQPFIDGVSTIDESVLNGVKSLVGAILALTGASVIEGIASWITGEASISSFAEDLPKLGYSLQEFSYAVADISVENIIAAAKAAKVLAEMTSTIPNEGGVVGWFAGENSISKFGDELPKLGAGLKGFSDAVADISPENIVAAANAAKVLAEMTSTIPNEGGIKAWFSGENSISKFGDDIVNLGKGLKGFSDEITGIVPENIIAAANSAKVLADMTQSIPNEGGIKAWFSGESSISKFADDIVSLGKGLKGFSDAIAGTVPENVLAGANAAKALAEMTAIIPNQGGIQAWFAGENSISKFASDIPLLGKGLKGFSDAIAGTVPENVLAGANAAKALAEMTAIIPSEGGIKAWFTGETSISKFGGQLSALGKGLKGFSDAIAGVAVENISLAANAAKTLAQMTAVIPNEGGIKSWFTGESSVANFSGQLPKLGKGIKSFSDAVVDISPENIVSAANAAKALAQMTATIPKEGGIKAWFTGETSIANFASKLPELGEGLTGFSKSVADIKPDKVTAASNAAKSLAEMTNTVPKDTSKIVTFGTNISSFGDKLKSYFSKTSGISAESISASKKAIDSIKELTSVNAGNISSTAKGIDKMAESMKNLSKVPKDCASSFTKALSDLGKTSTDALVKAFNSIDDDMKKAGQKAINAFISGIKNTTSKAKTACVSIIDTCSKAMSSSTSSFKSAGMNLATGFADGISINAYKAKAQARAMAKAAAKAAEEALDINSPSKVFYDIGDYAGLGFVNALYDYASTSYTAGSEMAVSARDGLNSAIKSIRDIVSGNMDLEPVISPVLDLSNVKSAAGSISSLFGGDPSLRLLAHAGSVSTMMNRYGQNGDNSDIVSAIGKLRSDISSMPRNTYNINGINYSGDADIENALQTIIQAARMGRRV